MKFHADKRAAVARGDAAAKRWLEVADVPLDLAVDLSPGQRIAVRRAIDQLNEYDRTQPAVNFVFQRIESIDGAQKLSAQCRSSHPPYSAPP